MSRWWKTAIVALAIVAIATPACGGGEPLEEPLPPAPKTPEDAKMFRELPDDEYRDYMGDRQQP